MNSSRTARAMAGESGKAEAKPWLHFSITVLLAIAFAFTLATLFIPSLTIESCPNLTEIILLVLATITTLSALERQLPLQNVMLVAVAIAVVGGGISALGEKCGVPFGPFTFTDGLGAKIFKTLPWTIPLLWIVVILNSRGVARLILRPWRKTKTYGFWLIGLTAVLVVLLDFAFDPFAARVKHFWFWTPTQIPLTWQSAPLVNFLSWGIVTLLILAFITPALIRKQLSKRSTPDFHPLCVWAGGILLFGIACAQNGLWTAVAVQTAILVVTTTFAIRGARW